MELLEPVLILHWLNYYRHALFNQSSFICWPYREVPRSVPWHRTSKYGSWASPLLCASNAWHALCVCVCVRACLRAFLATSLHGFSLMLFVWMCLRVFVCLFVFSPWTRFPFPSMCTKPHPLNLWWPLEYIYDECTLHDCRSSFSVEDPHTQRCVWFSHNVSCSVIPAIACNKNGD